MSNNTKNLIKIIASYITTEAVTLFLMICVYVNHSNINFLIFFDITFFIMFFIMVVHEVVLLKRVKVHKIVRIIFYWQWIQTAILVVFVGIPQIYKIFAS